MAGASTQQLLSYTAKVKQGAKLAPAEEAALRGVWGGAYDAKMKQYGPAAKASAAPSQKFSPAVQGGAQAEQWRTQAGQPQQQLRNDPAQAGGYDPRAAAADPQGFAKWQAAAKAAGYNPQAVGGGGQNQMGVQAQVQDRTGRGGGDFNTMPIRPGLGGNIGGNKGQEGMGGGGYTPSPYTPAPMPSPGQPTSPGATPVPGNYYTQPGMPTTAKPTDAQPNTMDFWRSDKNQDAMASYSNYNLPYDQLKQQAGQWAGDHNELARQFDTNTGITKQNNEFSQGLAGRQQGFTEWQGQEQAKQFGQQLGFEQLQNTQQYGLQNKQFDQSVLQNKQQYGLQQGQLDLSKLTQAQRNAIDTGQLGVSQGSLALQKQLGTGELALKQSQQGLDENWRKTQAQLEQSNQANQLTQSRYSAFGRAQAPQARMMKNW